MNREFMVNAEHYIATAIGYYVWLGACSVMHDENPEYLEYVSRYIVICFYYGICL
jgi:hypothetical protein